MFSVAFHRQFNLVDTTLSGLLTPEEVRCYAAEVEPIIWQAHRRSEGYTILLDVAGCAIQTQQVVGDFQSHVAGVPRARRCAVVTGSSIIRMQVRRIVSGPSMRIFDDRKAAMHWLTEKREDQAA